MRFRFLSFVFAAFFVALSAPQAFAQCTGPDGAESQTRYDFTAHKLLYCDGTNWVSMA